jgi:hypothetical protein
MHRGLPVEFDSEGVIERTHVKRRLISGCEVAYVKKVIQSLDESRLQMQRVTWRTRVGITYVQGVVWEQDNHSQFLPSV